jgi:hypothetical protein
LDAVAGLPAGLPVHACAMGPASDQGLMEKVASLSKGRYFFMPSTDNLFEIFNYIRSRVTGDAIVANESVTASSNRVAAFVDSLATEATFSVASAGANLRFVAGDPKNASEVGIRLRDPRGRLLHPDDSYLRRKAGQGYAVFTLQEPMPGQWFVEIATFGATHARCTVAGFVRSPLRLSVSVKTTKVSDGLVLKTTAQIFEGASPVSGAKATAQVIHPLFNIPGLLQQFRPQLQAIQPPVLPGGDRWPIDIARLTALRAKRLKENKPDLFQYGLHNSALRETVPNTLSGSFKGTQQKGSYNVVVTVQGTSPVSNTRFVRRELVSLLAR